MDTTALSVLGQQLTDFLMKQFSPPPGTATRLGFLGSGVAVDPGSFTSAGVFNPALVNSWLDIVVDPLGSLGENGSQVQSAPWTASQLMETIYTQALSTAPAGSEAKQSFDRVKSQAMQSLGGAITISTAPLDWYNPAQIPNWPSCSLSATSKSGESTTVGNGVVPPLPRPAKPLWAWRTLTTVPVYKRDQTIRMGESFDQIRRQPAAFSVAASPMLAARTMQTSVFVRAPVLSAAHVVDDAPQISVARAPAVILKEHTALKVSAAQALSVSEAISSAADSASTSSVQSTSLSLSLKYLVIQLSRAPWWNEFMLSAGNWYIPTFRQGSLVDGGASGRMPGLPIALILTSDVSIQSNWSQADRNAVATSTHFGPWALNLGQSNFATDSTTATLSIPGVQAIACLYRELPSLPPAPDPSLPAQ